MDCDDKTSSILPSQEWTPGDIWLRLNRRMPELLKEDRRFERKNHHVPDLDNLAVYYSMFSNSPEGGVFVYGVSDDGVTRGVILASSRSIKLKNAILPVAWVPNRNLNVFLSWWMENLLFVWRYIVRLSEGWWKRIGMRHGSDRGIAVTG